MRWLLAVGAFLLSGTLADQAQAQTRLTVVTSYSKDVTDPIRTAFERAHPGHTSHDGLHLKPSGAVLMAGFIASVVNSLPT